MDQVMPPAPMPAHADMPDRLAGAVLEALARPLGGRRSWGLVRTLIFSLLTFGILPVLIWSRRLRQTARLEERQFSHLTRWLREHSNEPPEALDRLERQAHRVGGPLVSRWASLTMVVLLLIAVSAQLNNANLWWQLTGIGHRWMQSTYGFSQHHWYPLGALQVWQAWTGLLILAYSFHWLAVTFHASRVRRFIAGFNRIAINEGVEPVRLAGFDPGIRVIWLLCGALMAWKLAALWAIPMMIAGAKHRSYIRRASTVMRSSLARRLRTMMLRRRPMMAIPTPVWLRDLCGNNRCRLALPEGAQFCPRCGSRAKNQNRVA